MSLQNYLIKVKHILPVFIIINIGSVIVLALLRWIYMKFTHLEINEEIWKLLIPMAFPWISILLWLRKRLRILVFKRETEKRRFIFYMVAWLTMSGMNICSQMYMTTATGKLETVDYPTQIGKKEKAHYYEIREFFIPKGIGCYIIDRSISGKHNKNLNLTAYFAIPMFKNPTAPAGNPKVWCCIKFYRRVNNNLSSIQKEKEYALFAEESKAHATKYDFSTTTYFTCIPASRRKDRYMDAIKDMIHHYPNDEHIVLEPNTTPYEERNGSKLPWTFGIFAIGTTIFMFLLIWPRLGNLYSLKSKENSEKWSK